MPKITSKYTIICDDVRREDNGKLLFVGVYLDKMLVSQFPIELPTLCFYELLASDKSGTFPLAFRFENTQTGDKLVHGEGELQIPETGQGIAIFRFMNVKIPAEGRYQFVLELQGQDPIVTPIEVTTPEAMARLSSRESSHV